MRASQAAQGTRAGRDMAVTVSDDESEAPPHAYVSGEGGSRPFEVRCCLYAVVSSMEGGPKRVREEQA